MGSKQPPEGAAEAGERPPVPEEAAPSPVQRRSVYRHPLAAVGGSMVVAGSLVFLALFAVDLTSGAQNPYRALVTFIGLPALITLGALLFLLALRLQVVKARKQGVKVRFHLRVEPSDPSYMRNLWLFLGLLVVLLVVVAFSGLQAYQATESVAFCGDTCHTVMEPQAVTYEVSPHARVACAECHIGPGASFWVKSKVDGLRQVWKTITDSFDRPIATPIRSLRPAQETCEECHWPEQFYGQKLITRSYYRTDEANSPWTISLLMNIGGGDARTGGTEGIHWQMIVGNTVEYIATDPARQEIAWVRRTDAEGNVTVYTDPNNPVDPQADGVEVRRFDCIDCHNRPSHRFLPAGHLTEPGALARDDLLRLALRAPGGPGPARRRVRHPGGGQHAHLPGAGRLLPGPVPRSLRRTGRQHRPGGHHLAGHLQRQLLPRDADGLPRPHQQPEPLRQQRVLPLPLLQPAG